MSMYFENFDVCTFVMNRIICILAAILLDIILGDPHFMPHIVRIFGKNIERIYKSLKRVFPVREGREDDANLKIMLGQTIVIRMILGNLIIFGAILFLSDKYLPFWVGLIIRTIIIYQCISAKQLQKEALKVINALNKGMTQGREALSNIVGRDTNKLDYEGVVRASVETVAENTSDGVIAPLFYIFIFGAMGGVVYKVVNTMDSMLGYKSDEYIYTGRCAAKTDDVFNYIPSRIAAIIMIWASRICGYDAKNAKAIWKRDSKKSSSPNSGQTESVVAGALNIRLLGPAFYDGILFEKPYIGDDIKRIDSKDVNKTIKLMYWTEALFVIFAIIIATFLVTAFCMF